MGDVRGADRAIAVRHRRRWFGIYRKSGFLDGAARTRAEGRKAFEFVRAPEGWWIAAFAWYDQP
ncbi:hypothetical protein SRIMM317S_02523 [Streptomyces rimosus subsp. rimosus]